VDPVTLQLQYQLSNLQWTVTFSNYDIRHDACPALRVYIARSWLLYLAKTCSCFHICCNKSWVSTKICFKNSIYPSSSAV